MNHEPRVIITAMLWDYLRKQEDMARIIESSIKASEANAWPTSPFFIRCGVTHWDLDTVTEPGP